MAVAVRIRVTRRVTGQFTWLHPFQHHAFNSITRDVHSGRGGGIRTPVDAVLETAALPLSYISSADLQTKSRLGRSRAACRSGVSSVVQDIDKRTSPPVKAQNIALRSQYWLRSLASDELCITIIMGASFYARRCTKSIETSVNNRFIVAFTPPRQPFRR
jgi:hypothetical protein